MNTQIAPAPGAVPPMPATYNPRCDTPRVATPANVAELDARRADLLVEAEQLAAEKAMLKERLAAAKVADIHAEVDAVADGAKFDPKKLTAPAVEAELADVARRHDVTLRASAKIRAELVAAIRSCRVDWRDQVAAEHEQARQAYESQLAELQKAAARLTTTSGALAWLNAVDRDVPLFGSQGRLDVRIGNTLHPLTALIPQLKDAKQS
ncbi:MAG TPA: hypothetical protein VGH82_17245 [Gaiellaceae bacterium]|jgi:ribosomal protein L9